jgi:vacuolar-type H+-ATPase subunit H
MKREDLLLALKDAEEKTRDLIDNARKEGERSIAKAKQDAVIRLEQERGKLPELKEKVLTVKLASIEEEARIIRERGIQRTEKLRKASEGSMNRVIDLLIESFESDVDV